MLTGLLLCMHMCIVIRVDEEAGCIVNCHASMSPLISSHRDNTTSTLLRSIELVVLWSTLELILHFAYLSLSLSIGGCPPLLEHILHVVVIVFGEGILLV